ncbi:hypothetical protein Vafri_12278 [Volvox africanus]|uniref:Uncharacterized protein n=1 Tax=Volvox africanus TaxID=51714 RepID=A0A8J4BAP8_9CHLO|nr:hypothetical protein Vafri_12278 [Volvox africanus]
MIMDKLLAGRLARDGLQNGQRRSLWLSERRQQRSKVKIWSQDIFKLATDGFRVTTAIREYEMQVNNCAWQGAPWLEPNKEHMISAITSLARVIPGRERGCPACLASSRVERVLRCIPGAFLQALMAHTSLGMPLEWARRNLRSCNSSFVVIIIIVRRPKPSVC